MEQKISLAELKNFCEMYDKKYGKYPESKYEGEAVLLFIYENLRYNSTGSEATPSR